jgi:phosphate transport system permease protein
MNRKTLTKLTDMFWQTLTFLASSVSLFVLGAIVVYVFNTGWKLMNIDLIRYDYRSNTYIGEIVDIPEFCLCEPTLSLDEETFYSEKWGVALKNDEDVLGKNIVMVEYVHQNSPLNELVNKSSVGPRTFALLDGYVVRRIAFFGLPSALDLYGAETMIQMLDGVDQFRELELITQGGGIRGSIYTTLWLVGLTLMFALPIGVASAIYLNEFASKRSRITRYFRQFIELLTGVPSIVYGLMGLAFFVPLVSSLTEATGPSLISGALTLAVIVLPVIIRTTEESLRVIPDEYRQASYALGATKMQTVTKVILPSAFPGILSATLLAIGRIVGESAALIFAIGVIIRDEISIFGQSTSLAVHIYAMLTDEPANTELSATISIIIIAIVLVMNFLIKLATRNFAKKSFEGGLI